MIDARFQSRIHSTVHKIKVFVTFSYIFLAFVQVFVFGQLYFAVKKLSTELK